MQTEQTEKPPAKKLTKHWWCLGLAMLLVLLATLQRSPFVAIASDGQLSLLQFTVRDESETYHTESLQTTFRPHGSSWNSTKSSSSHFASHLRLGNQEGTFYFSLVSESPPSPDKPIRVRIEFR